MQALLKRHPLSSKVEPGPKADLAPSYYLEQANRILDLIQDNKLEPNRGQEFNTKARRLTADEEKELIGMVHNWGDKEARDTFVRCNVALVKMVASQWARHINLPMDDIVQAGMEGLLRAIDGFDPTRGLRFSTYATPWIRAKIQRLGQKHRKFEQMPITGAKMAVSGAGRPFRPTAKVESIEKLQEDAEDPLGKDSRGQVAMEDHSIEDFSVSAQKKQAVAQLRTVMAEIAEELKETRAIDLLLKYRLLADSPETLQQVGQRAGCSREWIRMVEVKVLKLAKKKLLAAGISSALAT